MDQSNALHRLLEAADLIKMIEDLTNPGSFEKLSGASISGLRITLRNIRENILNSHDQLAGNFVNKAKAAVEARSNNDAKQTSNIQLSDIATNETTSSHSDSTNRSESTDSLIRNAIASDPQRIQLTRRDLRASLEKMVDR